MAEVTIVDYIDYTCSGGDTFDMLAAQAYGEEMMASVIIAANPDYSDMLIFEGGEEILVPVVDVVETPDTLPPWRR